MRYRIRSGYFDYMESWLGKNPDFLEGCRKVSEATYLISLMLGNKITLSERMAIYSQLPQWPVARARLAAVIRHHPDRVNCIEFYRLVLKVVRAGEFMTYLYQHNRISLLEYANHIGRLSQWLGSSPEEAGAEARQFLETVRSMS